MANPISLLLVEDHPIYRDGLAMFFAIQRPEWLIECAASVSEAKKAMASLPCTVAVIDIGLQDEDGFQLARQLMQRWPDTACLLLSARERPALNQAARAAGVRGFIDKSASGRDILAAIDRIIAGDESFAAGSLAEPPSLTERQTQILALLKDGHSNKEMRYRLGIAERTVRAHLTELFQALGVHSRMQAVMRARELGLIE